MVVQSSDAVVLKRLDLAYLGYFLGLRVNDLVMKEAWKAGFQGVRESHGFVVQHLIESERTISELAKRMEVTQQAASKITAELVGLGIVEMTPAEDRRAKSVRLTKRGWECVELGRRTRARIEKKLMDTRGKRNYEKAKMVLLSCLERLGGVERVRGRRIREPR
jgi:DNA-binding MarR family transcriptional regulator